MDDLIERPLIVYYAIGLDYGYEGKTPPLTLARDKETADAIVEIMAQNHGTKTYCVPVSMWPSVRPASTQEPG